MTTMKLRVLLVRYIFLGIVAYELTKIPFFVLDCKHESCSYYPMPQFINAPQPLTSSRLWIFSHQILAILLATIAGFVILGYDINFNVIAILCILFALQIAVNMHNLGPAPGWLASVINVGLGVIILPYCLYKRAYLPFLIFLTIPIWFFDTIAFLAFIYQQIFVGIDSKYLLFLINLFTRDEGFGKAPIFLKLVILGSGMFTFVYATYVFVTIPDRTQEKKE